MKEPSERLSRGPVFTQPSKLLLQTIVDKNQSRHATFYLPTKYISSEIGLSGKALSDLVDKKSKKAKGSKTFFCSSHLEGIYGAIKIMRHNAFVNKDKRNTILILDPKLDLIDFFNPLKVEDSSSQVIPNVICVQDVCKAEELIEKNKKLIGFIALLEDESQSLEIESLINLCKINLMLTAVSEGLLNNWHEKTHKINMVSSPDIYIFGENLLNSEMPFGAICISKKTYSPWNTINDCLTHSSTYTGNTLALTFFLMLYHQMNFKELEIYILENSKNITSYFESYINPVIALLYRSNRLNPKINFASRSKINLDLPHGKKRVNVIDCVGGSGCSLRGHNPEGIEQTVYSYQNKQDYWSELSKEINKLTGLGYCIPAISGSSAVDLALTLAILAINPKKTILTFKENYSGKSLLALNLSRFQEDYEPFAPLYPKVIEFDPFSDDANQKLETLFKEHDIALVWFEVLQGESLSKIPKAIIQFLMKNKKRYQYFIGIDEVLTGFFRTGSFLNYQQTGLEPDLVAIGKGMSDMTFPLAGVLLSDQIYSLASTQNAPLVKKIDTYYLNQLGACIALHALRCAQTQNLASHAKLMEKYFKKGIEKSLQTSTLIKDIKGEGLMLYLNLNKKCHAVKILGPFTTEFILTSIFLNKKNLHLFNLRITSAVNISQAEMDLVIAGLSDVISRYKSRHILFYGTLFLVRYLFNSLSIRIKNLKQKLSTING